MKPQIEAAFLPPDETARSLGVGKSTLAKMRMRGDGPEYVRVGRSILYPRDGAVAWMGARRQLSTSENQRQHR